jgi:hypothetical protein
LKQRTNLKRASVIWPALLVAVLIGAAMIGAPFRGFGAHVSLSSGTSYELRSIQLADGKSVIARWNPCQTAITYQVNLSGVAAAKRPAMLALIKKSFVKLAAADGMNYRYTGTTTFIPRTDNLAQQPAEIVVAAVARNKTNLELAENSLGFGGVLWSTWSSDSSGGPDSTTGSEGAAVVRGYVVLNPALISTLTSAFGAGLTQGNVILHELGHATGLEHVKDTHEQMTPVLTSSAPDGYSTGDLAGLKRIGSSAGCISIPSSVKIADLS